MKKIIILGSTGTVGSSVLDVISINQNDFQIDLLVAFSNYKKLLHQANEYNAKAVCLVNELNIKLLAKDNNIIPYDELENYIKETSATIVIASSGTASIKYFLWAIKYNKDIIIANKESIVCLLDILPELLKNYKGTLLPIDSEHNSLFQVMQNVNPQDVSKVMITGSGGSLINIKDDMLSKVSKKQVITHPNWNMGAKITVDSATFVNKSLEVIEASALFNIKPDNIEVVMHKQSILHAGVYLIDGSFIGSFYFPSMNIPIAHALYYPSRGQSNAKSFSLLQCKELKFEPLITRHEKVINLAKNIITTKGNSSIIFNIANEVIVNEYIKRDDIKFTNIIPFIENMLNKIPYKKVYSPNDLFAEIENIYNQCMVNLKRSYS